MKSEWWRGTAWNAFKTYFAISRNGSQDAMSPADERKYHACDRVFRASGPQEQEILRMFFECAWGDDRYVVEDYSERTGISQRTVWTVIKKSGHAVMEELGLMDRGVNSNADS